MNNPINHPSHYNVGKIEVIDAIEDWKLGFNLGNVVKYVARADYKENALVDLEKAAWYLNREIERRKNVPTPNEIKEPFYPGYDKLMEEANVAALEHELIKLRAEVAKKTDEEIARFRVIREEFLRVQEKAVIAMFTGKESCARPL